MQLGPRTVIFVVLLMVLPVSAYFLMFKPRDALMRAAIEETREKQDKLATLDRATAEVKNLPQEVEKLRKAIAFFEGKLPEEKEMDKVLREVWTQAEKNGLSVKSVRNLAVVADQNYSEQPIRMVIVGSATGFYKFLQSVEQLPRITRVGEMTIEADPKGDGIITSDLVLTIFFEAGEKSPA
jgi:Tfp pilus assembly protein PilO